MCRTKLIASLAMCLIAAGGCRSSSNNNGNPDSAVNNVIDGSGGGPPSTTVAKLRQNQPAGLTPVNLGKVVIVGWVTSSKYGHIWVQDPGGGPYSGIQLFCNYGGSKPSCTMSRTTIEGLMRGQVVSVTGNWDPYTPSMPANAPTEIEISSPVITQLGSTMAPVASTVTAADIKKDAPIPSQWDGAYVKMTGTLTVSNVMDPDFENTSYSCTTGGDGGMSASAPHYFGFQATDSSMNAIEVGLSFYKSEDFCLGDTCWDPMCTTKGTTGHNLVSSGDTFTSITGVLEPNSSSAAGADAAFTEIDPVVDGDLPRM